MGSTWSLVRVDLGSKWQGASWHKYDLTGTQSKSSLRLYQWQCIIYNKLSIDQESDCNSSVTSSENEAASLLLERVVALLGESLHQDVVVGVLLHVLHNLRDWLGHRHAMNAGLNSQLLHQLALRLQSFLELTHLRCRCTLTNNNNSYQQHTPITTASA